MSPQTPTIANHGQVRHMSAPDTWVEQPIEQQGFDLRSVRKLHVEGLDEVQLCLFYRGHPTSGAAGDNFRRALEKPPHDLSQEELWSLQEILRTAAQSEAFDIRAARTEEWNGRTVLFVEGWWKEVEWGMVSLFVDADGTGCVVQEIYYTAPADSYERFLPEAMEMLGSIEWTEPPPPPEERPSAAELWGLKDPAELLPVEFDEPPPVPDFMTQPSVPAPEVENGEEPAATAGAEPDEPKPLDLSDMFGHGS